MIFVKSHTLSVLVFSLVLTSCAPTPKLPAAFPTPTIAPASPQPTSLSWKDATIIEFTSRESKGLKLIPSQGDGKYKVIRENGNEAIQTSGMLDGNGITNYLYFDLSDDFYHGGTQPITITIEYLDEGYGAVVLEYDSNATQHDAQGSPAYRAVYPIVRSDSKEWKEATYTITDALFRNRQNFGADFRLSGYNTPLTIRKVAVSREAPAVITPTRKATANSPAGYPAPLGEHPVFTYYFYWYDIKSGFHITAGLTDVPSDLYETSMLDSSWHRRQLEDIAYSGIDVILPIVWFDEDNLWWSFPGLEKLTEALEQVRQEGITPPAVAMFADTTSSEGKDLRQEKEQKWVYEAIHKFFSTIPRSYWALADGKRPMIWFYYPQFPAAYDQSFIDYIYSNFESDFGVRPYLVFDTGWDYPAQTVDGQKVIDYNAPHLQYDASFHFGGALAPNNTPKIASIGPGYDDRGIIFPVRDPKTVVDRNEGTAYRAGLGHAVRCSTPWLAIETWNEFHEGTDIAETREYGRQYIELTRELTGIFKQGASPESGSIQTPYTNSGTISVTLGETNEPLGLDLVPSAGDGQHRPVTVMGNPARETIPMTPDAEASYLYFTVDDGFYFELPQKVKLTVEYFDKGFQPMYLEYDSLSCGSTYNINKVYRSVFLANRTNTMQWKTISIVIPDAHFANHQNWEADFRLVTERDTLVMHRVSLEKIP